MSIKKLNYLKGKTGERIGEAYLISRGYQILERNVKSPFGEIDVVANHQKDLVFIEIKSRKDDAFGFPEESVNEHKRGQLARLASWYLTRYSTIPQVRFDVLAIQGEAAERQFRLIQNAIQF